MYRVFTGAPAAKDLAPYQWQTVTLEERNPIRTASMNLAAMLPSTQYPLPPATIEAASRRISLIYQNAIFGDDDSEGESDGWPLLGIMLADHCVFRS